MIDTGINKRMESRLKGGEGHPVFVILMVSVPSHF